MRRIFYIASFVWGLFILVSCGGEGASSSLEPNEYLGKVPSIVQTYQRADSLLEVEKEEKLRSTKDLDELRKYGEEREKKKEEAERKRDVEIAKEREKLLEKTVPAGYDGITEYEVTDLKIWDIGNRGDFTLTGKLKFNETIPLSGSFYFMYFEARDEQGKPLWESSTRIDTKTFGQKEITAGTEYDIRLFLYTDGNPGLSRFSKLVFIPKKNT